MSNYTTLAGRVDLVVQDQGSYLTNDAKQQSFRDGLARYSRQIPHTVTEEFTGDGDEWQFDLASTFLPGFSVVTEVEYPIDQRPPAYLGFGAYIIYPGTSATVFGMPSITPGAGEKVRVRYSGMHTINGLDSAMVTTIPEWHFSAFVALVASRQLIMLANRFIHEQDSTIDADAINRSSKVSDAAKRAKALEEEYLQLVGMTGGVQPAGTLIDWDATLHGSGRDFQTHPRGWR